MDNTAACTRGATLPANKAQRLMTLRNDVGAWPAWKVPARKAFPETGWDRQGKVVSDSIVHPALDGFLCFGKDM